MQMIDKIMTAFRHAGSGKNVSLYSLARNAAPFYMSKSGNAFSPLTIFLSVNSVCNAKCKMCDIGQKNMDSSFFKNLQPEGPREKLDFDRLEVLMKEASDFPIKPRISVTTTEPLLYKDLFRLAELVSRNGMEFQFTTNGFRLRKYVDRILESGVDEIGISIDGPAAVHNEIRGIPGMYESITDGLAYLKERAEELGRKRPTVTILTVVSNHNYKEIFNLYDQLPEDLYDRGIVSHMNFMNPEMVAEHNAHFSHVGVAEIAGLSGGTMAEDVEIDVLWDQIIKLKKYTKVHMAPDYTKEDLDVFYNKPMEMVWDNTCYIPWFVMEILSNGDVIPLTRCMHKKLGNIYENNLMEIWKGQEYRTFRNHLQEHKRFPICTRCRGIL
jgi:MoaA/NifB/PqqE/SkfB family radical SAM enzyme